MRAEFEHQIVDLHLKSQPETPPEVRSKRVDEVKQGTKSIVVAVTQCGQRLEEAMGVWTSVQNDPMVQQLCNELRVKEQQFVDIQMVAPTLVIAQHLARLAEGWVI